MWDLIVSVPDHCLSFYFVDFTTGRFMLSPALLFVLVFIQSCLAL